MCWRKRTILGGIYRKFACICSRLSFLGTPLVCLSRDFAPNLDPSIVLKRPVKRLSFCGRGWFLCSRTLHTHSATLRAHPMQCTTSRVRRNHRTRAVLALLALHWGVIIHASVRFGQHGTSGCLRAHGVTAGEQNVRPRNTPAWIPELSGTMERPARQRKQVRSLLGGLIVCDGPREASPFQCPSIYTFINTFCM
jgi:hypothetical protein